MGAVASIERQHRTGRVFLLIRPRPEAGPGQHGVVADPARWRNLTTRGLVVEQRGLTVPTDRIAHAAAVLSGGRVPVR